MYFGAKNINVCYGKEQVLTNISLEIEKGKTTAIIGLNGSGKSTLLKALGRLVKYDGQVIYKNENLHDRSHLEIARILALLPQRPTVPEEISVYELVCLGRFPHQKLTQYGLSEKDKDFVEKMMKETEVWQMKDMKLSTLSGGQRQRVFITMILVQDSELILLDEPTTYLDLVHQLDLLNLLKKMAEKMQKTVVYVLHDLNQVAGFADDLVVMRQGKLAAVGSVEEVFTEQMLKTSFGLDVILGQDECSGKPMITGIRNG